MPPLISTDPTARWLFAVALWIWLGTELWIGYRYRARVGASPRDRGSRFAVIGSVWTGVLAANGISNAVPAAAIRWDRYAVFVAGLAIMGAGYLLRLYAIQVLGRFFTVVVATQADQRVVDVGPYRYIRHPSYTGSLVTFFGMCLALTNWVALAALLLPIVGYGYRIAVEEAALQETLGDDYRAYMRRTKRLIPYIV